MQQSLFRRENPESASSHIRWSCLDPVEVSFSQLVKSALIMRQLFDVAPIPGHGRLLGGNWCWEVFVLLPNGVNGLNVAKT